MKQPSKQLQERVHKTLPYIDIGVTLILMFSFGVFFLFSHAWGAWGDDSPGYIYTAGQFMQNEDLVSQDELVQRGLERFGDEKLARFLAPGHHDIISPDGWIASKYPIGLGWLMAIVADLDGNDEAIYLVVPVLSIVAVVVTYWLAIVWLPGHASTKRLVGIVAALVVGTSNLFANYAVAQPMRDIPGLTFMALSLLLLGVALYQFKKDPPAWVRWSALAASGACLGMAMNIRETSVLLAIPVVAAIAWDWKRDGIKTIAKRIGILVFGALLVFSLSIWNSIEITQHKEKFRDKDITRVAVTSNFDHINSLSITNLYNNQGKFRPGVGGASQYWDTINQFSDWAPFIAFAIFGLIVLVVRNRRVAVVLGGWTLLFFLLFGMWINPYPRYILSIIIPVAVLGGFGMVTGLRALYSVLKMDSKLWLVLNVAVLLSFFVALQPAIADRQEHIQEQELVFKAISHDDLQTTKQVATDIQAHSEQEPLLLMMGEWKAGMSETMMAHSDVRVIRFPNKPKEQPPLDEFVGFINELQQDYDVFVWYDSSTTSAEQSVYADFTHELIDAYTFSFQSDIQLTLIQ